MRGLEALLILAVGGGFVYFIARFLIDQIVTGTSAADQFFQTGVPIFIWAGLVAAGIINVVFRGGRR